MPSPPTRPNNAILLSALFGLLAAGLWFVRIQLDWNGMPLGFNQMMETGVLPNGVALKRRFTGIKPADQLLRLLVGAFLYGPTKWNEPFYWHQMHFLFQMAASIAMMNVEACRERNGGSWLKYTALFAFGYQSIGGAIILPIWWILFHRLSAPKSYFANGRAVPLQYARLLLPSTLLIYLLPAILFHMPGIDLVARQNRIALWQYTPVFVNIPLWLASSFVPANPTLMLKHGKPIDLSYLRSLYVVMFVISTIVHLGIVAGISASKNPAVSLWSVFAPNPSIWRLSMDNGLHWIFQWDWLICALLHWIPSLVAVWDMQRILNGAATASDMIIAATITIVLTAVGGPAASMCAVWHWREGKLAIIEDALSTGKKDL